MKKGFVILQPSIILTTIAIALLAVNPGIFSSVIQNEKAKEVAQNFRNLKAAIENYWNTDKPTPPTAAIGAAQLVPGYINAIPANFTISNPTAVAGQPGVYSITIVYKGCDVDVKKVREYGMLDVYEENGYIKLTFYLQKWW